MSIWLGGLDALLTAVAAGATVIAVVIARLNLRLNQAAEQRMVPCVVACQERHT